MDDTQISHLIDEPFS